MAWTAPWDAARVSGSSHASTSSCGAGSAGAHMGDTVAALRELLGAFFAAYLEDATELRKQRMSTLLVQADARALLGPEAVQPLAALFASLQGEMQVDAQRFAAFYHFVFFVARERGHRNLAFATALEAWRFVLGGGRFALLEPWCDFVSRRSGNKGISEDTWCQVLDFAHAVNQSGGRLGSYDPHGAWPVLVDEFVDDIRHGKFASLLATGGVMEPETGASMTMTSAEEDRVRRGEGASYSTMMAMTAGAAGGGRSHGWAGSGSSSVVTTAMDQTSGLGAEAAATMVYNGGCAGGAGRGFGELVRGGSGQFSVPGDAFPQTSGGWNWGFGGGGGGGGVGAGHHPHSSAGLPLGGTAPSATSTMMRQPVVGCKRRLSAVLELDGLADQLERQARVHTPPIPVAQGGTGGVLTTMHSNPCDPQQHQQQNQHQQQLQQQHPISGGSPTRKYAKRLHRAGTARAAGTPRADMFG